MAREIRVSIWCDACLAVGQNTEAVELPPMRGTSTKPRVIALCPTHRKELFDPLDELLAEHGQPVDESVGSSSAVRHRSPSAQKAAQPLTGGAACPFPGCGKVLKNDQTLRTHCRSMHDKTLAEIEGAEVPFECPECQRRFPRIQSLAIHRRRAHDVAGQSTAAAAQSSLLD